MVGKILARNCDPRSLEKSVLMRFKEGGIFRRVGVFGVKTVNTHTATINSLEREQAAYSYAIGAFHYDVLFDYSSELKDDSLRDLVRKTHDHLMCDVKRQLEARNAKRRRRGQLTNPYMVPGWITNSVST
eukprot:gene6468-11920_t